MTGSDRKVIKEREAFKTALVHAGIETSAKNIDAAFETAQWLSRGIDDLRQLYRDAK